MKWNVYRYTNLSLNFEVYAPNVCAAVLVLEIFFFFSQKMEPCMCAIASIHYNNIYLYQ